MFSGVGVRPMVSATMVGSSCAPCPDRGFLRGWHEPFGVRARSPSNTSFGSWTGKPVRWLSGGRATSVVRRVWRAAARVVVSPFGRLGGARWFPGSNTGHLRARCSSPRGLSQMDCDVSTLVGAPRCVGRRSRALGSWWGPGESRRPVAAGGSSACVVAAAGTCCRLDEATL